jgi:amidohydrolase
MQPSLTPEIVAAIRERTVAVSDFVVETRRDIHAHPELGNQETPTAALVAATLRQLDFDVQEGVAGSGVVGVLRGGHPGSTLALRADMDALPLQEEDDHPYRSTVTNVMHACGHDGHVAMALGAARVLHGFRDAIRGNVKFLFQPAEETYGGANEMIAAGCLSNEPRVDAVFGLHLEPLGAVGELRVRHGAIMASADAVRMVIKGKGGHASEPHDCVDPVPVAAHVITALQTLVTRGVDVKNPVVLTITYLQAGTAFNVIPAEVVLAGTLRTVDPEVRAQMRARIEMLARRTAEAFGAAAEITCVPGSGVVVNHEGFTDFVRGVLRRTRGAESVVELQHPVMGAEDYGLYMEHVPGTFAFLGARPAHREAYPCHHPRFDIDERALPVGVEILSTVALAYLGTAATG